MISSAKGNKPPAAKGKKTVTLSTTTGQKRGNPMPCKSSKRKAQKT